MKVRKMKTQAHARKPNWQLRIALLFLIGVPLLVATLATLTHQS
jgi:hypothetical protein